MEPEPTIAEPAVPEYALYRPGDVAFATFLGSPVAGAIVSGLNSYRLGRPRQAWITIGLTALAMAALVAVLWNVEQPAGATLAILGIAAMYALEKALHGRALAEHARLEGPNASSWKAAGIGALTLIGVLAAVVGVVALDEFQWQELSFGTDDTVRFAGDVTGREARDLAGVLTEHGWFGEQGADAWLERYDGEVHVTLFLVDEHRDPELVAYVQGIGEALLDAGFSRPITIHLCDPDLEERNSVRLP